MIFKDPNAEDFRYDKDLIYLLKTYGSNVIEDHILV